MATRAERKWMDAITRIGCIVCVRLGHWNTPGVPHHLLTKGGRRRGHLYTICLCDPGHHQNAPRGSGKISRHPNRFHFESVYGSEESLLEYSRVLVERMG